jgi:repressor LexA
MIEDHVRDGDYVIVERRATAHNGETVVALLDGGEATLKRFRREGKRIKLEPANSRMKPIVVDRVEIQGVVVGIFRKV